jgi:hypothetical protein
MELRDALTQISEIRRQMARTEIFRGFRSMPIAFSGLLALAAAGFQLVWIPDPRQNIAGYLTLWLGAAVISALAAGAEMAIRYWRSSTALGRDLTWLAVEQFLPCLIGGAVLTVVLAASAPDCLWMLPGLWQMFFSLGIFATHRLLPKAIFGVAIFYMCTGVLSLLLAQSEGTPSPWVMGIPFGVGQLYVAAILYWTLERSHDGPQEQENR